LQIPKFTRQTQSSVTEAYCAALLDHVNIVKHHQTFIHQGLLVVASEYCGLGDLQTLIDAADAMQQPFTEGMVLAVLLDMCSGVAWMHRNSIAHRDIKPENVFVGADGVSKLGDLGSSRFMIDPSTSFVGTPLYMAPEVRACQSLPMQRCKSCES
jgi:serine/threonine protein kinase